MGLSEGLRLLLEFPRRSGREEDTDITDGFLLHFNTEGNSSTTGNSSVAGNSSCDIKGRKIIEMLNISAVCRLDVHSSKSEITRMSTTINLICVSVSKSTKYNCTQSSLAYVKGFNIIL